MNVVPSMPLNDETPSDVFWFERRDGGFGSFLLHFPDPPES
jgi:hypothetical protein